MALSILEYAAHFWVAVQLRITFKEELRLFEINYLLQGDVRNKS